ncbi:MAG: hypothetical protein JSW06_01345 [Thermoplasmatales archaeon]|nr:MAG: hypothetical protein JSW06_01345 [Thermoplasmatales archaeon]
MFKVRTNRAIGEESKELTCKYVGIGNTLPFPERDDKAVMIQKVADRISKMDDNTFERFITYIINHAQKDNRLNGVSSNEIREALYQVRNSDKPIPIFEDDTNSRIITSPHTLVLSACYVPCTFGGGFIGLLRCILFPFALILDNLLVIFGALLTMLLGC